MPVKLRNISCFSQYSQVKSLENICKMLTMNYHLEKEPNTLRVTSYLSRLTVNVDLRQAGRLFRRSEGLKLTEVGEVGLLGDLLRGGGGEHRTASWCSLCLRTVPGVRCRGLQRGRGGGGVKITL